jgi:hypothetical protein
VPEILKQKINRRVPNFDYLTSTGIKGLLYVPKGVKYNTIFFVELVVRIWWNTSVTRVDRKRFEALWSIWTTHDGTTAEKVRQFLLQQKPVESLLQLTVQIYLGLTFSSLECSRNECREHHTVR